MQPRMKLGVSGISGCRSSTFLMVLLQNCAELLHLWNEPKEGPGMDGVHVSDGHQAACFLSNKAELVCCKLNYRI